MELEDGHMTRQQRDAVRLRWMMAGLVLVAAVSSCASDDAASGSATVDTVPARTASSSVVEATVSVVPPPPSVELGGAAWSAKSGFGAVWIQVDPPVDQIVKVDEATAEVVLSIDGTGVAIGDGVLWVANGPAGEVYKMDPVTGEVLLTTAAPDAYYVAVGAGAVWAPNPSGVSRLDPTTGAVIATIPVAAVTDLIATDEAVWVTDKEAGTVTRIDPTSNTVVAEITTAAGAHALAATDGAVWVTNYRANSVSRIDPATNTVVATIDGVGSGVGIDNGDGRVFVSTQGVGISSIDPITNDVTPLASFPEWNYGLAYSDTGELWITSVDNAKVYHLDP